MAKGDVVSGMSDIANGAYLTFQPGAGVEVMLTQFGCEAFSGAPPKLPAISVYLYNGTIRSCTHHEECEFSWMTRQKLGITNTIYLQILNNTGSLMYLGYSGIQTKGTKLKVNGKIITGKELEAYKESWATARKEELIQDSKVKNNSIIVKRDGLGNVIGMEWSEHE